MRAFLCQQIASSWQVLFKLSCLAVEPGSIALTHCQEASLGTLLMPRMQLMSQRPANTNKAAVQLIGMHPCPSW